MSSWYNCPARQGRHRSAKRAKIKANLDWLAQADERNKAKRDVLLRMRRTVDKKPE